MKALRMLGSNKRVSSEPFSREVLARLEDAAETSNTAPSEKHFQFVVIHISENTISEVPHLIGKVVETVIRNRAMLGSVCSSIIVVYLGLPFPDTDSGPARRRLVEEVLGIDRTRVRVAHGHCKGLVGVFGAEGGWRYDAIIPSFSGVVESLLASAFGTAVEIPSL
jgi:hypothetical protein